MLTNKRITIYKSVVVLFILLYIVFSCFPCVRSNTWNGFFGEETYSVSYLSNMSVFMVVMFALQIVLLVKNRPWLQMLTGVLGALSGLLLPLTVSLANELDELMCIVGSRTNRSVTVVGWIVTIMAWISAALDIWLAVAIKKYLTATAMPAGNNIEGRDEVIQ